MYFELVVMDTIFLGLTVFAHFFAETKTCEFVFDVYFALVKLCEKVHSEIKIVAVTNAFLFMHIFCFF